MSHVFVSYSHKDIDYALKLKTALELEGFAVWLDHHIDYGTRWPQAIPENIDKCGAFIVIMTDHSFNSEWVQNELNYAQNIKKHVFPLKLDGKRAWVSVSAIQHEDVRGNVMPTRRFYDTLANFVSRRSNYVSKSIATQEKVQELVNAIQQGGTWWIADNAMYVMMANQAALDRQTQDSPTRNNFPPRAIASTLMSLTDAQKFQLKYFGWENMVYNLGPTIGLDSERFGKSWPRDTDLSVIAYDVINACNILGISSEAITISRN